MPSRNFPDKNAQFCSAKAATSWLLSNPWFRKNTLTHGHEKSFPQSSIAITCLVSVDDFARRRFYASVLLKIVESGLLFIRTAPEESRIFLRKIVSEIISRILKFIWRNCGREQRKLLYSFYIFFVQSQMIHRVRAFVTVKFIKLSSLPHRFIIRRY